MTSGNIARREWILLALDAAANSQLTALKLQKSLFLLGARRGAAVGDDFYEFRPYHYGPFSADVYQDADALERDGLISVDRSKGRSLRSYHLTDAGRAAARDAEGRAPDTARQYVGTVVRWAQPLAFDELVRAIYDAYPSMKANSIFEERD